MARIHETTLTPGKLDVVAAWLPTRPWSRGGGEPVLTKTGGFRLDDPEGDVGIPTVESREARSPRVTDLRDGPT